MVRRLTTNGHEQKYSVAGNQEILGSSPRLVISVFVIFVNSGRAVFEGLTVVPHSATPIDTSGARICLACLRYLFRQRVPVSFAQEAKHFFCLIACKCDPGRRPRSLLWLLPHDVVSTIPDQALVDLGEL